MPWSAAKPCCFSFDESELGEVSFELPDAEWWDGGDVEDFAYQEATDEIGKVSFELPDAEWWDGGDVEDFAYQEATDEIGKVSFDLPCPPEADASCDMHANEGDD